MHTETCTCKAEHWQPHAESCPAYKPKPLLTIENIRSGVVPADAVAAGFLLGQVERLQPFEQAALYVQGGGDLAGMIVQRDHWLEVAREKDAEIARLAQLNDGNFELYRRERTAFKNFHRVLCERFGYGHDEVDWERDQLSLIEWIARPHENEPIEQPIAEAHSRLMRGLYEWQNAGGSIDEIADAVRQMAEACIAESGAPRREAGDRAGPLISRQSEESATCDWPRGRCCLLATSQKSAKWQCKCGQRSCPYCGEDPHAHGFVR